MFPAAGWYHSNQYDAQPACEHCGGVICHEKWCITRNYVVQYAFRAVTAPDKLKLGDRLILHALGVSWVLNGSETPCYQSSPIENSQPLPSKS
ncbi:MAG TPA: hypothetical protein VMU05_23895 [Dongiaceae bacterium]|nr:hypothetical protein [Dongiaceae bacterium]